jgi:hypothetical protein
MMHYESDIQRDVTVVNLRGKHTRTIYVPARRLSHRAGLHDQAATRENAVQGAATEMPYEEDATRMIYKAALPGRSTRRPTVMSYKDTRPEDGTRMIYEGQKPHSTSMHREQGSTRYIRRAPTRSGEQPHRLDSA